MIGRTYIFRENEGTGSGGVSPAPGTDGGTPPAAVTDGAGAGSVPGAVLSRPEGLPDQYWDATANTVKFADLTKDLTELHGLKQTVDERKAQVPAKPEEYKLELPTDFRLPEGLEFKIDDKSPVLGEFRSFAHQQGWTQAEVSNALGLLAKHEAEKLTKIHAEGDAFFKAEQAKLGDEKRAAERTTAVAKAVEARFGKDALEGLRPTNAAAVEALEKLLHDAPIDTGSGGGGRPPEPSMAERLYGPDFFAPQAQQRAN